MKNVFAIVFLCNMLHVAAQDSRLIPNTWYCTEVNINNTQYVPVILPTLPNVPLFFDSQGPGTIQTWYCPMSAVNATVVHNSSTSFVSSLSGGLTGGCPNANNMGAAIDLFNDNYKQFWFQSPGLRTYVIQQSGIFLSMIITNANGDTAVYSTDATAGTYDLEAIGFTLYPNPSIDILNIQYNQNRTPLELVIYDIAGRKLISTSGVLNTISTSSLTSGNYFLQVLFDDGSQGTQRFIKN